MIEVRKLSKSFGGRFALRRVDLDVAAGECLAVVGPNGAGKTTLFRILAALSRPTEGTACIGGVDIRKGGEEIRRQVGFLSHQPLLYEYLSGEENLRFYAEMYDVRGLDERIASLLEQVGLARRRHDLVRTYSRGMKQRLAIARSLLHNPPVLLLDEPYTGLDQQAEEMLDALLRNQDAGPRTVLLATHNLEQGLRLGSQIVILVNGKITHQMDRSDWNSEAFRQVYRERTAGCER